MLKLHVFSHNHHSGRVKMLAKYIRRGISVINIPAGDEFKIGYMTKRIYLFLPFSLRVRAAEKMRRS